MNNGKLRGKVWHTDGLKQWESVFHNSNKIIDDVVTIDGVFIAVNPDNIQHWFDERFNGFHFYDQGFVIPNYLDGCNIGVMNNISILHQSVGEVNQEWENNRQQFCELYKDELPVVLGEDPDKLKVLICCQFFSNYTGSEMSNYELAKELVKQGCDVSLISTVVGNPLLDKAKKAGIKVHHIQEITTLQYYKFDILHINHKPIGKVVLQYFPNTPAVMHVRSEVIPVFEEPILHPNIKKYISIRPTINKYIESFGINENNIVHIDNPFDTSRFNINYRQKKNNKEVILYIGTLDYLRKNMLLDLKENVEKENKILWIIGSDNGNYANELISDNVKYLGIKSDVENYIKQCDYTAGIFTGRSTIEGFLCGKKGYVYNVDKQGNIINKVLMDVPEDIYKYSAKYSASKVIELYNEILK
jgi:glycosyltransferase involved in cell wall biosynthesis